MIKLATRSFALHDADTMLIEVTRSIIDAYDQAQREIPMPYLTNVEKRVTHSDVSFVLTFDSVKVSAEPGEDRINYVFTLPSTVAQR